MKTDYCLMSEYRDMVEKVSAVYGEKSKACINNYIDSTLVGEVRKWKVISALLLFFGILLLPILLGLPLILGGITLYILIPRKMESLIEQYKVLVKNDNTLE